MTDSHGRRRASARRALLVLSTILSTGLAAPALAQSFRTLDANGIDLVNGDFVMALPEGTIGSGEAALSLIRTGADPAASQWDGISFTRTGTGAVKTIVITHDRRARTFTGSSTFSDGRADGATLTQIDPITYVYGLSDGSQITFTNPDYDMQGATGYCSGQLTPPTPPTAAAF